MRWLLVLACWAALPGVARVACGSSPHLEALYAAGFGGAAATCSPDRAPLSWAGVAECKAECARLQQKSVLHTPRYDADVVFGHWRALAGALAAAAAVAAAAGALLARRHARDRAAFAARESELLARCHGIQQQAAGLGELAQRGWLRLAASSGELQATQARLADALQLLAQQQEEDDEDAPVTEDCQCQTEDPDAAARGALAGECSTPELEHLVASAPGGSDADACRADQDASCASAGKGPLGAAAAALQPGHLAGLQHLIADAKGRGTPASILADVLNHHLAEEGLSDRFQVQPVPSPATVAPEGEGAGAVAPPPSGARDAAAQQPEQQLQGRGSQQQDPGGSCGGGGDYVTREDLERALLSAKLQIKEESSQLRSELLLVSLHTQRERSPQACVGGFVNTSRGSSTPLPFYSRAMAPAPTGGSGGGAANAFTQFSPLGGAGASVGTSSSGFRALSTPGGAGSARVSPAGGWLPTPASSATSCTSGRAAQVAPVPMQPLEGASPAGPSSQCRRALPQGGMAAEKLLAVLEQRAKENRDKAVSKRAHAEKAAAAVGSSGSNASAAAPGTPRADDEDGKRDQ